MAQSEFNRDMDKYIKRRKDDSGLSINLSLGKKNEVRLGPDAEEKSEVVSRIWGGKSKKEDFQDMDDEIEEMPEDIPQEKNQGAIKKFFNFFKTEESNDELNDDMGDSTYPETVVLDEDVKDALKLALKWIEKLPNNRLREFKTSGDAERLKEVLIRYGVAKQSEDTVQP